MKSILDQLEKAEVAATKGPWEYGLLPEFYGIGPIPNDVINFRSIHNKETQESFYKVFYGNNENANLIALSRNHIRALIQCARTLNWYATSQTYEERCSGHPRSNYEAFDMKIVAPIVEDRGQKARMALAGLEGEK